MTWWTVNQIADSLAVRPATVRSWLSRGRIRPAARHGRERLYDVEAVRQALVEGRTTRRGRPGLDMPSKIGNTSGSTPMSRPGRGCSACRGSSW